MYDSFSSLLSIFTVLTEEILVPISKLKSRSVASSRASSSKHKALLLGFYPRLSTGFFAG